MVAVAVAGVVEKEHCHAFHSCVRRSVATRERHDGWVSEQITVILSDALQVGHHQFAISEAPAPMHEGRKAEGFIVNVTIVAAPLLEISRDVVLICEIFIAFR